MPCNNSCPIEQKSQDAFSPGVIGGGEVIVRGAYHPNHGNKNTGNVKPGFLPIRHLHEGRLSVWRIGQPPFPNRTDIIHKIPVANDRGDLFAILGTSAKEIRSITKDEANTRMVCVRDECECDSYGNKDVAHAHISLCDHLKSDDPNEFLKNEDLNQAHTKLRFLFHKGVLLSDDPQTMATLHNKYRSQPL